jgi:ABC-type transport system involved in multi-copper enzyme maturation permease subunit
MSGRALVEKEFLSLLRGWKMVAFLAASGILASAFIYLISADQRASSPAQNIETAGLFVSLQIVFCLGLFASDIVSGGARDGTLQLHLLLPRRRSGILLAKLFPPILFYFIGAAFFSLVVASIQNSPAFLELWWARLAVDTLLFFALLFLVALISVSSRGTSGPVLALVLLMLLLFFSPYLPMKLPFLNPVNPFSYEYDVMSDLGNGTLENPSPAGILAAMLFLFAALAFILMERKEVAD